MQICHPENTVETESFLKKWYFFANHFCLINIKVFFWMLQYSSKGLSNFSAKSFNCWIRFCNLCAHGQDCHHYLIIGGVISLPTARIVIINFIHSLKVLLSLVASSHCHSQDCHHQCDPLWTWHVVCQGYFWAISQTAAYLLLSVQLWKYNGWPTFKYLEATITFLRLCEGEAFNR